MASIENVMEGIPAFSIDKQSDKKTYAGTGSATNSSRSFFIREDQ